MKHLSNSNIKTLSKIANGFGYEVGGTVRGSDDEMYERIHVYNIDHNENSIRIAVRYDDSDTFAVSFAVEFCGFGVVDSTRENEIMKNLNNAYACVNVLNGLIGGLRNA